jgi:NAD(P)-dependent dehydrogenase (short-subunit alcohol dehydrogenase family)
MSALDGRVAIVTGASGGIGLAAAQAMAAQRAAIVIADIQDGRGEQAAAALCREGARAHFVQTDVASEAHIASIVEVALEYATAGIRVNAVYPGIIHTQTIGRFTHGDPEAVQALQATEPVGRLGEPQEIGAAAAWLCSDAASFVTVVALPVDEGFVAQ